jgi:hypothetical protein
MFTAKSVVAYTAAAGLMTPEIASVELDADATVEPANVTATVLALLVDVAVKEDSPPPVTTTGVVVENVVPVGNVKLMTSAAASCALGVKVTVQVAVCPALTAADAGAKETADADADVLAPANVTVPRSAIAITTTMTANLLTRFMGLRPDVPSRPTE